MKVSYFCELEYIMYALQYTVCKSRRLKKGVKSALLIILNKIKSAL